MGKQGDRRIEDGGWYGLKSGLEMRLYGFHTCFAVFESRKNDIIRVYVAERKVKTASAVLKFCADNKKAYHIVTDAELEKIIGSVHHEGIGMVVKKKKPMSELEFMKTLLAEPPKPLFFMDGVSNPHNLGAIMRTLAHFGIKWMIGNEDALPELSASAARTSEGASELVQMVRLRDPVEVLNDLKARGYEIIGTSSHNSISFKDWTPKAKTILVLGAESTGISDAISKICTKQVAIPGTGNVESLNVSVAAGIFASHLSFGLIK
ncbi:MAG: TrmH family RNA methyltransferase [Pseudomonadota bacterium]